MNALASTLEPTDGDVFERIAQAIERHGYAVMDAAIPPALLDGLFVHLCNLPGDALTRAGIGREQDHQLNRFVRSDETRWLEPDEAVAGAFLDWMEQLRQGINRRLFLGLFDYEAHYARYSPGAFYRRHRGCVCRWRQQPRAVHSAVPQPFLGARRRWRNAAVCG
ncbi:MAG: hypothetical protein KIS75_03875 [Chromatiales bacterium]|nr:hypothetical protein [Chromatiales bacterium]